jgi:hypothetical protein
MIVKSSIEEDFFVFLDVSYQIDKDWYLSHESKEQIEAS